LYVTASNTIHKSVTWVPSKLSLTLVWWVTSAPLLRRSLATWIWPFLAAMNNAVHPSCTHQIGKEALTYLYGSPTACHGAASHWHADRLLCNIIIQASIVLLSLD